MRCPQRKAGIYTNQKLDPHITKEKFNELKDKLVRMKKSQSPLILEVKRLAEMGDFSENAAYQIAKGRLRGLNQKIFDIEKQLSFALIIDDNKKSDIVILGSSVLVEINNKIKKYKILGSCEVDLEKNIISYSSPIGSALMGKKIGDLVIVQIGEKNVEYKILEIK